MPFITQCPNAGCRKFMLLEDRLLGGEARCLICRQPFQTSAAPGAGGSPSNAPASNRPASNSPPQQPAPEPRQQTPPRPSPQQAPPPRTAPQPSMGPPPGALPPPPRQAPPPQPAPPQTRVVTCPSGCGAALEIPSSLAGQAVQCPSCNTVFTA